MKVRADGRGSGTYGRARAAVALLAVATTIPGVVAAAASQEGVTVADAVGELLDAHRSTGRLVDELDGGAGEFLTAALADSEAFLVGEVHRTREVPELTRVLLREGRGHGFGRLAVEVGPVTAEMLADAAAEGIDAIAALHRRSPFAVPFFDGRGEGEFLVEAVALGYALLGLDQEFIGSPRILLDRLDAMVDDPAVGETIQEWRGRELQALQRFLQSQDMSGAIMPSTTPEQFAALRERVAAPAAQRIVDEMAASAAVYQAFRRGDNYRSNHDRIALMKAHLRAYRDAPGASSRLLAKFGAMHMGRGYSPLNQLDLGNHLAELAAAAGGRSFHLITLAGGTRAADGSVVPMIAADSYLRPLLDRAAEEGWTLFDLRPLRPFFHRDSNREAAPELAELVFRYDAVAMRQEMTAAEELR